MKKSKLVLLIISVIVFIVVASIAILLFLRSNNPYYRATMLSVSMEPAIKEGETVVINSSKEVIGTIAYGDIVAYHVPDFENNVEYIHRVVGFEGDEVMAKDGILYVNQEIIDYGVIHSEDFGPFTVEDDSIFVLGDNAELSADSRYLGSIPKKNIVGKVVIKASNPWKKE